MDRIGKTNVWIPVVSIVVIALLGLAVYGIFYTQPTQQVVLSPTSVSNDGGAPLLSGGACSVACPTDLVWAGTVNIQNSLNKTGVETYDTSSYFFDTADSSLKATVTDTSSGAVSLTCGRNYKLQTVSSSGAAGDSSYLGSADLGTSDSNGNIVFNACGDGTVFTVQSQQHGLWEVRAFDLINNAYFLNQSNHSGLVYHQGTPLNFTSTTSNTTGTSVSSGGELHARIEMRANVDDQNLNDRGIYVLIDAASNRWNVPNVKVDGTQLQEIKGSLSNDERRAYANYEYVFLIPQSRVITQQNEAKVDFSMFALSGIDPTAADQPTVAFAPIGQYVSTKTNNLLIVSSVQDNSANTAVHTLEEIIFDVA